MCSIRSTEGAWRRGPSEQWTRPETALVSQHLFSCSPIILESLILISQLALYSKHILPSPLHLVARASSQVHPPLTRPLAQAMDGLFQPVLTSAGENLEALVGAVTWDAEVALGMEDTKAEKDKGNPDP